MYTFLKHNRLSGKITAAKHVSTAVPSVALSIGKVDLVESRDGAGDVDLEFAEPTLRYSVAICTPSGTVTAGNYACTYDADEAYVNTRLFTKAGAGVDGEVSSLIFQWDTDDDDVVSDQWIYNTNGYDPVIIPVSITSAGVVSEGGTRVSCVKSDTGVYDLTWTEGFGRKPVVIPTLVAAAQSSIDVSADEEGCTVHTFNSAEAATDLAFNLFVLGWRNTDDLYGRKSKILVPGYGVRIVPFKYSTAAGAYSTLIGSGDITGVYNGVGDATITFTNPGNKKPVVFVSGASARAQVAAMTASTAQILSFNAAGAAAEQVIHGVAITFENTESY